MDADIPWQEFTTLSKSGGRDGAARMPLFEGRLDAAVRYLAGLPRPGRNDIVIALPDRAAPPFRYAAEQFDWLIASVPGR